MDQILCGLPFAFIYLDDILIASRTRQEHEEHIKQVLSILKQNGLVVNSQKCVFAKSSVEFLVHTVSAEGVSATPKHLSAIADFPFPPWTSTSYRDS